ncbi:hypothetical protein BKA70DRAFT_1250489 [Coprinopsis sp. MPI-PUGE-AT-0042]|nr:hypothetical protein BKA70DRAFT_1250489 [Coprinopsis sp. MPI-PUGE-AT-0042]
MADCISSLPLELVHQILSFARPRTVAAFSQTNKAAYAAVYGPDTQHLWRSLYLSYPLDDPLVVAKERLDAGLQTAVQPSDFIDWRTRVQQVASVEMYASRPPELDLDESDKDWTLAPLSLLHSELRPAGQDRDGRSRHSFNAKWIDKTLSPSTLLSARIDDESVPASDKQSLSRMRVCLNRTFRQYKGKDLNNADTVERRTDSRVFVYDLQNYGQNTNWGPFRMGEGGTHLVDWVHLEHLLTVIWLNICEWGAPFPPRGMECARAFSAPDTTFSAEDWAGVEGSWSRYVCFMDYRDLFAFNFSFEGGSRPYEMFTQPEFREATRLLDVNLKVITEDQYLAFGNGAVKRPLEENVSKTHPIIYFTGDSRGLTGTSSGLRGYVFMDIEGNVQWHFVRVSLYDNTSQWSSTAAQIGGVGSAMGLGGIWTTAAHEPGDPAGPFWMWKNDANHVPRPMDHN